MKEIKFTEWVAENHYRLVNVENGIYYWKNENDKKTTEELYIKYANETSF